jgi:hypothetical protein
MITPTLRIPALLPLPLISIQPELPSPALREHRVRDFGVGYGRSSGYASQRQYANAWNGQPHFRCG